MKILSKYKDYYDFQIGVYGEDPNLLLDRRSGNAKIILHDDTVVTLFVGNKVVQGVYNGNQFYLGKEVEQFKIKNDSRRWIHRFLYNDELTFDFHRGNGTVHQVIYHIEFENIGSKLLPKYEKYCKDFAISMYMEDVGISPYPKLEALGINKIIDAKTLWNELSDFLSMKKQEVEKSVPIGDDNLRIESHGFDLKTSFRNVK